MTLILKSLSSALEINVEHSVEAIAFLAKHGVPIKKIGPDHILAEVNDPHGVRRALSLANVL